MVNILKRLLTVLSVAVLAVCCGAFVLFSVSGTGWKALSIPTGSMRPHIPPGSVVLVHSVPASSLKVGDVITYANPVKANSTITHRIIKTYLIDNRVRAFITKGDANKVADTPIVSGSVKGMVVWHAPYIGYAMMWLKTWPGIFTIIYLPAVLIIAEEIMRLNEYYKKAQPYRVPGFGLMERSRTVSRGLVNGVMITLAFLFIGAVISQPVLALLMSNTVTLGPNTLSVAAKIPPKCSGNSSNTTNINISNSSNQSASSGNASNSGNTTGGSATSGNASNSNSSSTTVTITNNC